MSSPTQSIHMRKLSSYILTTHHRYWLKNRIKCHNLKKMLLTLNKFKDLILLYILIKNSIVLWLDQVLSICDSDCLKSFSLSDLSWFWIIDDLVLVKFTLKKRPHPNTNLNRFITSLFWLLSLWFVILSILSYLKIHLGDTVVHGRTFGAASRAILPLWTHVISIWHFPL